MGHWPTTFVVSELPPDHPYVRHLSFKVKYWKEGLWAVTDGVLEYDEHGETHHAWDFPDREAFIATIRFTKERALEIAEELVKNMVLPDGRTAKDVIDRDDIK